MLLCQMCQGGVQVLFGHLKQQSPPLGFGLSWLLRCSVTGWSTLVIWWWNGCPWKKPMDWCEHCQIHDIGFFHKFFGIHKWVVEKFFLFLGMLFFYKCYESFLCIGTKCSTRLILHLPFSFSFAHKLQNSIQACSKL